MNTLPDQHPAIRLVQVCKAFGHQKVLERVDLDVVEGGTTVITGASGQGKSVMMKLMLGLLEPDEGKVLVFGQDLSRLRKKELREVRRQFGVLFQNVALFDSMTVYENVAMPLRERTTLTETEIRSVVHDRLEMMDLVGSEEKFPPQVSGGMKKRVGLARALVLDPKIVFFDEPTTGLDVNKSNEIYRLFYRTQNRLKYTAVMVSHDVPKIFKLCDYVALLADRKIQGCIPPDEFQRSENPHIRAFVEATMGTIYSSEREESDLYEEN